MIRNISTFIVISIILQGCLAKPIVKIDDPQKHKVQNELIINDVLSKAQTGDWLVIRGYHDTDNLVANVTNTPISHVGIYNKEENNVIEATAKGIAPIPLYDFVNKSYRLLIIKPRWANDANRNQAIAYAKRLIGKKYDFLGTIGFNYPDKFYCSELAIYIYKPWFNKKDHFPSVITPGELYLYGQMTYDSRPRNEF